MSGGSGSGKSTVAEALVEACEAVGVVIFHEDGYYWPMSHYGPAETEAQRQAIIAKVNYDDPVSKETSFMARQLADLKAGQTLTDDEIETLVKKSGYAMVSVNREIS